MILVVIMRIILYQQDHPFAIERARRSVCPFSLSYTIMILVVIMRIILYQQDHPSAIERARRSVCPFSLSYTIMILVVIMRIILYQQDHPFAYALNLSQNPSEYYESFDAYFEHPKTLRRHAQNEFARHIS
nr:hypothetical protein [Paenibacillus polymyxa]